MTERLKYLTRLREYCDELESRGYNVLVVMLQGSQNYNLHTKESDIDAKAIVIPSMDNVLMNKKPTSTTVEFPREGKEPELVDVKDIRLMVEQWKKQNIAYVELLRTDYFVWGRASLYHQSNWESYNGFGDGLEVLKSLPYLINKAQVMRSIMGMSMEKRKAMTHEYPSKLDILGKYGYDPKQLHHIVRIYLMAYVLHHTDELYYRWEELQGAVTALVNMNLLPKSRLHMVNNLLKYKTEPIPLQDAIILADELCEDLKIIYNGFYKGKDEEYLNVEALGTIHKWKNEIVKWNWRKQL